MISSLPPPPPVKKLILRKVKHFQEGLVYYYPEETQFGEKEYKQGVLTAVYVPDRYNQGYNQYYINGKSVSTHDIYAVYVPPERSIAMSIIEIFI